MNKHLEVLKAYQAWRRDDENEPRTLSEVGLTARSIGAALDWAIAELTERPSETEARKLAQQQLESEREEKRAWGLQLSAALNGGKRPDEPGNDGRLDAVRAMKRENDELRAHVERLREYSLEVRRQLRKNGEYSPISYEWPDAMADETPRQSLAEIKSEVARNAVINTLERFGRDDMLVMVIIELADEYANAIRQEADL